MSVCSVISDDKYYYCPKYDTYLRNIKPTLKKRAKHHLTIRENKIQTAFNKTMTYSQTLGCIFMVQPQYYTQSFITDMHVEINKLIDDWDGPLVTRQYKQKFDAGTIEPKDLISNEKKFNHNSRNRFDQISWNITGKFFAMHIKNISLIFFSYCQQIDNISQSQRTIIYNCISVYFAVEFLSTKVLFCRTKEKPLIRDKTLTNSNELHAAFKILYHKFEIANLKKTIKTNMKKTHKGSSKYRIKSGEFAENVSIYCKDLLNELESQINFTVPVQHLPYTNHDSKNDSLSDTTNNSLSPTPRISYQPIPSLPPPQYCNCAQCCYTPLPIHQNTYYTYNYVQGYNYSNNLNNNYQISGYGNARGGCHINSAVHLRSHPYNQYNYNEYENRIMPTWTNCECNDASSIPFAIGDYVEETYLHNVPILSECMNTENAINAV